MSKFVLLFNRFYSHAFGQSFAKDAGQTTVEYAIAVVFVIGLAIASFGVLQPSVLSFFATLSRTISSAAAGI